MPVSGRNTSMSETSWTVINCILTSGLYGLFAGFLAGELLRKQRSEEHATVVTTSEAVVIKFEWADSKLLQFTVFLIGVVLFYLGLRSNSAAYFAFTGGLGSFAMPFVCLFYWRRYRGYFRAGF